jgi:hypothetical protein
VGLRLVAQQLSCSSIDEVQLCAGQTNHSLKLIFGRVVIIQPVLDLQFGRGTGEEESAHGVLRSSIGPGLGPVCLGGRASQPERPGRQVTGTSSTLWEL